MKKLITGIIFTLVLLSGSLKGQNNKGLFAFDSMEVKTINGLISTVYNIISGDAGDREWDRFRALFYPGARFISVKVNSKGEEVYFEGTVDEYIEVIKPILGKNTYYEHETSRSIQESNNIAQIFSIFESILFENGNPTNLKGANSFQIIYKNNRWWITSVLFNSEPRQ